MIDILQRLEFTVDVQADGSWDVSAPLYLSLIHICLEHGKHGVVDIQFQNLIALYAFAAGLLGQHLFHAYLIKHVGSEKIIKKGLGK